MTALNLGGMFGGGQPQAAPAPVPGPLAARPDLAQRVPLANAPTPPVMPPEILAQRRRAQLASAPMPPVRPA